MPLRAFAALLACLAVLGLAACGGGGNDEASGTSTTGIEEPATTQQDTTTEETTTEETTSTAGEGTTVAAGDAAAGKAVFTSTGCGNCHVLAAAGTNGAVGPNLDQQLASDAQSQGDELADFTRESIENPDDFVAEGYQAGVMPSYDGQLDDKQMDDLVAFIVQSVQ
jgi:mono/diheme cytochrome c family protein